MAFIEKDVRGIVLVAPLGNCPVANDEELTFAILTLVMDYVKCRKNERITGAAGALTVAAAVFNNEVIVPHTQQQKFENGAI